MEKLFIILFLIFSTSCKPDIDEKNQGSQINKTEVDEIDAIKKSDLDSLPIEVKIHNEFEKQRYFLAKNVTIDSTDIYFNSYKRNALFDVNKIIAGKYTTFQRKVRSKIEASVSILEMDFISGEAAYEYILATNKLLEIEPINYKAPSFFTKKGNTIFIFRTHAFMYLKYVKDMKLLCDSLVIKPDTTDIRMASECTYNIKMDTYYKTK